MAKMRNDIYNKIMLYNSHPVADMFKDKFECRLRVFHSDKLENHQLFGMWCFMEELEMEWGARAREGRECFLRGEISLAEQDGYLLGDNNVYYLG